MLGDAEGVGYIMSTRAEELSLSDEQQHKILLFGPLDIIEMIHKKGVLDRQVLLDYCVKSQSHVCLSKLLRIDEDLLNAISYNNIDFGKYGQLASFLKGSTFL